MILVILAAACFVTGIVLTPIKLREIMIGSKPRLLPSTFFTCCAGLGFAAAMTARAGHVAFWGAITGIAGGFLGTVATLLSIPILPRWQWLTQLVTSASAFIALLANLFM